MLIISMRDNENNTWKRNAKTKNQKETTKKSKQDRKEQGGGGGEGGEEAIVKGWGLNDFVVHQFHLFITHLVTDFIIIM